MPDPQDIVEIDGVHYPRPAAMRAMATATASKRAPRRFLSIWFRCCHVYGRIYRNDPGTMYEGHCPRCGARVHAMIGPGGTNQRMFEAR